MWDLGLLREQLANMKLDWELPPLQAHVTEKHRRPITVTFPAATNSMLGAGNSSLPERPTSGTK
jgi:hypothetical protein